MANFKFKKVTKDGEVGRIIHEEILDDFCENYILVGEDHTCLGENYVKYAESIKNFEVRNSDCWVATYPKAGTTWTQEMVWLIANDLDFKGAESELRRRFPFLEVSSLRDTEKFDKKLNTITAETYKNSVEFTKNQKNPRFIKTHLPYSLLPDEIQDGSKSPKLIYVMRNPKDVCVSYYHHGRLMQGWKTNLENFAKVFKADKAMYGSFWKHVLGYWEHRNNPNVLIIKYEDMKADLPSVIRKVSKFLKKELTDEQVEILFKHLSFESMKRNKYLNAEDRVEILKKFNLTSGDTEFIRSGTVGKYKEELSAETIKEFDAWIKNNIAGTSFEQEYDYSL